MNKKISLGAAICFMAIAAAITFTITMTYAKNIFNTKIANVDERAQVYEKISEIDQIVRNNYLNDIDEDELINAIADGYMNGLEDDYAYYMDQEEYNEYKMENAGELIGIGVTVTLDESGYIRILEVNEGSPAEQAGLQAGDLITKVGDVDVLTEGYQESTGLIRGEEGTKVTLTIHRDQEELVVEVTRKLMDTITVTYRMIGENGYIKISKFDSNTPRDFKAAVEDLEAQGATGLIFDVRDNPGGLLDSVAEVLDYLLPEGDIVSSTDSKGNTEVLYTSDADFVDMPMVVICNGETASAAELFSAGLRDYQKAELVGVNTFGKGIMQTSYSLADGSAINFTTHYYNPPSGVNFHGVGLKPDYEVQLTDEQALRLGELSDEEDAQLQKAISVLDSQKSAS
ncbi:MAG TPA: S41 family peptidase [Candidatus Merdivicinus intestinigallinarum]|nr:S41 family peptidase [Candidatus Merdivicinus intestinigallinarum]